MKYFSKSWKSSKRPAKQRKYLANAPLHIRKKFVSVNLSKQLREKEGKRNLPVKKDDKVKVLRGRFKKKEGKITKVFLKQRKVTMDGVQVKKRDGSNAIVKLEPSNLQIVELGTRRKKGEEFKSKESSLSKEEKDNVSEKTESS